MELPSKHSKTWIFYQAIIQYHSLNHGLERKRIAPMTSMSWHQSPHSVCFCFPELVTWNVAIHPLGIRLPWGKRRLIWHQKIQDFPKKSNIIININIIHIVDSGGFSRICIDFPLLLLQRNKFNTFQWRSKSASRTLGWADWQQEKPL